VAFLQGTHRALIRYDRLGRPVELANFAPDGSLINRMLTRFNRRGNLEEMLLLGPNGRPANQYVATAKASMARMVFVYDEDGQLKEATSWRANARGKLVLWTRLGTGGRVLEFAYLDLQGKAILDPEGEHHRFVCRYDQKGRIRDTTWFGSDGKPATSKGAHRRSFRYDSEGGFDERCFGSDGKPVVDATGVHRKTFRHDRAKRRHIYAYFDSAGKPVAHTDGNHQVVHDLDTLNRAIQYRYLGLDGKPVRIKAGYARLKLVYRDGTWVDSRAFDTADKEVPLVVVVRSFKPESEAEGLGLKKGDVLLTYSGKRIRSVAWLRAQQGPPGKETAPEELEVQRGQKRIKIKAEPGKIDADIEDVARSVALPR
jgi:hypothetical protein